MKTPTYLYGSGFNAHGQIDSRVDHDCSAFHRIFLKEDDDPSGGDILFAGWSETAIRVKDAFCVIGHKQRSASTEESVVSAFGDHSGVLGYLTADGCVHIFETEPKAGPDAVITPQTSKHFTHVVIAGNGHIAAIEVATPHLIHEFSSYHAFLEHLFASDSDVNSKSEDFAPETSNSMHKVHQINDKVIQLVANTANFCILDDKHRVYTWGDNRYGTLGREGQSGTPQMVEHLSLADDDDGTKVVKIVAGGWMMGAVRDDGLAWVWGSQSPGTERVEGVLSGEGGYIDTAVEIEDESRGVLDVVDMAIGDGFVVVVCEGGRLVGAGDNGNGQLADSQRQYLNVWTRLTIRDVLSVWAGSKTVFMRAE